MIQVSVDLFLKTKDSDIKQAGRALNYNVKVIFAFLTFMCLVFMLITPYHYIEILKCISKFDIYIYIYIIYIYIYIYVVIFCAICKFLFILLTLSLNFDVTAVYVLKYISSFTVFEFFFKTTTYIYAFA